MNETTPIKSHSVNEKTPRKIPWLLIILLSYSFILNLSLYLSTGFSGYIFLIGLINFQFFIIQSAAIKIPFIFKNKSAQFFELNVSAILFFTFGNLLTNLITLYIPLITNFLASLISFLVMCGIFYVFYICIKRIKKT